MSRSYPAGPLRPSDWTVDPDDRTTYYGATDIARILGVSRYGGPLEVYLEKRVGLVRPSSPRARWGQLLEDAISDGYAEATGYRLRRVRHLLSRRAPLVIAHPDRLIVGQPGIFDAKATEVRADYGEPGTDEVPPWVKVQMLVYCGHSGRDWAEVGVLPGSTRGLALYRISADPDFYGEALEAVEAFHVDHVLADVPPSADGTAAWDAYARERWPRDDGSMLPATDAQLRLVHELRDAAAELNAAKARFGLAQQRILEVMKEARVLPTPWGRISWATSKASPRWKRIAESLARDLADQHPEGAAGILEVAVADDTAGRVGARRFTHPFTAEEPTDAVVH